MTINWIKFDRNNIPPQGKPYLKTDGKRVAVCKWPSDEWGMFEDIRKVSDVTHYAEINLTMEDSKKMLIAEQVLCLIQEEIKVAATLSIVNEQFIAVTIKDKTYTTEYNIYEVMVMIENKTTTPKQVAKVVVGTAANMEIAEMSTRLEAQDVNMYYVISVKSIKGIDGQNEERWRYAGYDNGSYGSGDPCWTYNDRQCKTFSDLVGARAWFQENDHFLFGQYYNPRHFDLSTLGIRQVVHKMMSKLSI